MILIGASTNSMKSASETWLKRQQIGYSATAALKWRPGPSIVSLLRRVIMDIVSPAPIEAASMSGRSEKQTIGPPDIEEVISEILGPAGGFSRQASPTPLIDLERRNPRRIESGRIVDAAVTDATRAMHHDDRRHAVNRDRQLEPRAKHDRLPVPFGRIGQLVDVETWDIPVIGNRPAADSRSAASGTMMRRSAMMRCPAAQVVSEDPRVREPS